jgi:O-antigen/teichoic acid export membrane protein
LRGILVRVFGLAASVVLAHLLTPHQFGLIALAAAMIVVGDLLSDAGLGGALIRSTSSPALQDLEAIVGFQLAVTLAASGCLAIAAVYLPSVIALAAVMSLSLPIAAWRTPGYVLLQRALLFRPIARAEVVEFLVYNSWAIATVAIGWNVWGVATAVVVRSLVGTVLLTRASPAGFVVPRLHWARVRRLLGFGARYQAVGAVSTLRDQFFNMGIGTFAGATMLGFWDLGTSLLQAVGFLYESLWRVSFPAMARLRDAGTQVREVIERTVSHVAIVAGALVAGVVGPAPCLVPVVFGDRWYNVVYLLPGAGLGLLIVGPVSVATVGHLFATGRERVVLRSGIIHTIALFAVTFPLLGPLGPWAIGIGFCVSACIEAWILGRTTARMSQARIASSMIAPLVFAVVAGGSSWLLAVNIGRTLVSVAVSIAVAEATYILPLLLLRRPQVSELARLAARAARSARTADPTAPYSPV